MSTLDALAASFLNCCGVYPPGENARRQVAGRHPSWTNIALMAELVEGDDFYYEGPYMVFTEKFLRERGYCCESGCRHCPYGFRKDRRPDIPSEDQSGNEER